MATVRKIEAPRPARWEAWEIGFLSACWGDCIPAATIAADLRRTEKAVRVMVVKLGLGRPRGEHGERRFAPPVRPRTPHIVADHERLQLELDEARRTIADQAARIAELERRPAAAASDADLARQRVALRQLCILVAIEAGELEAQQACRALGLSAKAASRMRKTVIQTGVRAAQATPAEVTP